MFLDFFFNKEVKEHNNKLGYLGMKKFIVSTFMHNFLRLAFFLFVYFFSFIFNAGFKVKNIVSHPKNKVPSCFGQFRSP